jgi:hypothetical protein
MFSKLIKGVALKTPAILPAINTDLPYPSFFTVFTSWFIKINNSLALAIQTSI